ncbi:MAG: hypothetical protein Q9198_000384 [Flavoplaca austrocitrina]
MSLQEPVEGFDYLAKPKNPHPIKRCKQAFDEPHKHLVDLLFDRAKSIVQEHQLSWSNFKDLPEGAKKLSSARDLHAKALSTEFIDKIEVKGYPGFRDFLAANAIRYASGSGASIAVREFKKENSPSNSPLFPTSFHSPLPPTPLQSPAFPNNKIPGARNLPLRKWGFICCTPAELPGGNVLIPFNRVMEPPSAYIDDKVEHVRLDRLWDAIRRKLGLDDTFVVYRLWYHSVESNVEISVLDDEDLQACINHHAERGRSEIVLHIVDPDSRGLSYQSTSNLVGIPS